MRVLIIGVGDAFTRRHFGSSALIRSARGFVLIDCPDLIHRAVHEASAAADVGGQGEGEGGWAIDVAGIDDIIITHLHGDHCNGLESFGFYRRIMRLRDPGAVRPRLHVTQPVAERVWERLAPAMETAMGGCERPSTLADYFDVRILTPGTVSVIAGLQVQCRFTQHPVPTIGLVLIDGEAPASELRSLGWSADTPFEPAHVQWLDQAQVIVHESNLGPSHTPIEKLNALPSQTRRKIRLIHLVDDFDPACTDMQPLREGEVL